MLAESQRLHEPSAMDIMGARLIGVDQRSGTDANQPSGGPQWLDLALAIEERQ